MIKLPNDIENEMALYRLGAAPLPKAYTEFHKRVAAYDLSYRNWKVIGEPEMIDDGWMDDFKALAVVVERFPGVFYRYKWHTSGAWFRQDPSGAWVRDYEMLEETRKYVDSLNSIRE